MKAEHILEYLNKSELQEILMMCGKTKTGSKDDLINRIIEQVSFPRALEVLNYTHIKRLCSEFNVEYDGKKSSINQLCQLCNQQASSISNNTSNENEILAIENELENMVGLNEVKQKIKDLIAFSKIQQERKNHGLQASSVGRHLVFTGNPGTGKTTIARIIGKVFKAYGLVRNDNFKEVKRSDLVGKYIGHSESITQKILKDAIGGVLFIDEAYSLAGDEQDFGKVVIETLMIAMENYRDEMVIIVAGYKDEMDKFLKSNPGLKSRFNYFINFEDYTNNELIEIIKSLADKNDYTIDSELEPLILEKLIKHRNNKEDSFANARLARNIFESMLLKQAIRLSSSNNLDKESLQRLTVADFASE